MTVVTAWRPRLGHSGAMSDIALTEAARSSLLLLQRTADARADTTRRLARGLRVERPVDDPADFFRADALRERVSDLLSAKDSIGQATSAVGGALVGVEAIEDLTGQLKGIALAAQGGSAEARQAAAQQFDVIRQQITALANDVSFGGVALLAESSGNLEVNLDGEGLSDLTIENHNAGSAGLGIGSAISDFNGFSTDADIHSAVAGVNSAITTLRARASSLGNDVSVLNIRERFNDDLANTLETGAAKLVNADLNQEGARLVSTQVREQLGIEGLRVAQQSASILASLI
ncbi:MAG: hypothetical protein HN877_08130 [Rhodospirillaceae bacterium]|nr:hypothetical protein [Rhodospirillaceae bacterium]